jgi:hypothetical protein
MHKLGAWGRLKPVKEEKSSCPNLIKGRPKAVAPPQPSANVRHVTGMPSKRSHSTSRQSYMFYLRMSSRDLMGLVYQWEKESLVFLTFNLKIIDKRLANFCVNFFASVFQVDVGVAYLKLRRNSNRSSHCPFCLIIWSKFDGLKHSDRISDCP